MPYSSLADVEQAAGGAARMLQLADWGNNAAVDQDVVARAIVSADALIDTFASKLYHVPFNPVPPIIKDFSAELAMLTIARGPHGLSEPRKRRGTEIAGTDRGN